MARTVDPERYAAKRLVIIDAALTCFAAQGYDGATTAAICRQAGIGSGTFFHYFPAKVDVLLAILDLGTGETAEWFAAQEGREDPRGVLRSYVEHARGVAVDPRVPGFVRAVGALLGVPEVAAALTADDRVLRAGLEPWVSRAQRAGEVRADLPADRLTSWLMLLLDGFLGRLADDGSFSAAVEGPVLHDAVDRLLAP